MRFSWAFRLMVNNRMVCILAEDRWRNLPAQVAVDAGIVDEEIARHISDRHASSWPKEFSPKLR